MKCSYVDQLGQELIEVYRRNHDQLAYPLTGSALYLSEEVVSLHHAITKHRESCPLCHEIDRTFANAIDRRVTSP